MEDKDLKYQIIEADNPRDLAERVTVFLNQDWVVHGSPLMDFQHSKFAQAVTFKPGSHF